jgi:hypothetical protein
MNRQHIIDAIRSTAKDGKPLGNQAFTTTTGIREHEWRGKFWARWGDALIEAGYLPNEWGARLGETYILESLAFLTRKLKRYPTLSEIEMERRVNKDFPSSKTISVFSNKSALILKLIDYSLSNEEYADIREILESTPLPAQPKESTETSETKLQLGYVYLMLSAKKYKIGYSKAALNRTSVVSNMSPEGGEIIHLIRTDDMRGIEAYWHNRFADKRGNGEWFSLSASDVAAFKRRKFM